MVFLRTMVAKTTRTVIIIQRTLDHINNFFILQLKKVVAILYSRDSNCKAYNYHKVAGDNFLINISAIPRMQQCSINIVSLNKHMALNLNEYMFLK